MISCGGCGSEYAESSRSCPACGLGAGERLPDLAPLRPLPRSLPAAGRIHLAAAGGGPTPRRPETGPTSRRRLAQAGGALAVVAALVAGIALYRHRDAGAHGAPAAATVPATAGIAAVPTATDVTTGPALSDRGSATLGSATPAAGVPASRVPVAAPPSRSVSAAPTTPSTPRSVISTGDVSQPRGSSPIGPVSIAPALRGRPETATVTPVLATYFDAINNRDRAAWTASLVPNSARNDAAWASLRTTHDSQIRLLDVRRSGAQHLLASVSFVSRQDPKYGPSGSHLACTRWSIGYPIDGSRQGSERIDLVRHSRVTSRAC